jgi:molybdopterin-containing oxidoreductase family iron-sulfur binding subunit
MRIDEKIPNQEKNEQHVSVNSSSTDAPRREFLRKLGSGIFASLLAPAIMDGKFDALANSTVDVQDLPQLPDPKPDEDVIVRMMRDVQRALKKPVEERKWGMVIDLRKCVGCHACTISCVAENKLPPGVVYRPVLEEEVGTYPNVRSRFIPRPCMQCDKPPCVPVCPASATWKREDGVVEIDYEKCIGCRYCITACPYSARVFDSGHYYTENAVEEGEAFLTSEKAKIYEEEPTFDWGEARRREEGKSPIGNARKCHFCLHRVEKGLLPECVVTCIGRATFFGDLNDTESLVSELAGQPNVLRLKEEMGTDPKVYYLM